MTIQWYVIKHVPDLVRREPRNVGVIVVDEDAQVRLSRFLGEGATGDIDGRSVGSIGNHLVYKAWVKQWLALRDAGVDALTEAAELGRKAGASFFVEAGGTWLVGDSAAHEEVLSDLYVRLVREDTTGPVADDVRVLSDRLFRRLGLSRAVERRVSFQIEYQGAPDELWFDYRYDNGQPHLMQRVGLAGNDKNTWDRLHLVEFSFARMSDSAALAGYNAIALVKKDHADARLVRALDERLKGVATVVDVADEQLAQQRMRQVLHLDNDGQLPTTQ